MKLVIVGDSWGCGSWSTPEKFLLKGDDYLTTCFTKHYSEVRNNSIGAISNLDIAASLQTELHVNSSHDRILIIQTDPARDFIYFNDTCNIALKGFFKDNWDYKQIYNFYVDCFYFKLQNIATKYNKKINLIGGLSDVDVDRAKKYPSINVVCDSWIKLLCPEHVPSSYSVSGQVWEAIKENYLGGSTPDNNHILKCMNDRDHLMAKYANNFFGKLETKPVWRLDTHPTHKSIEILVNNIHNKLI